MPDSILSLTHRIQAETIDWCLFALTTLSKEQAVQAMIDYKEELLEKARKESVNDVSTQQTAG